MGSEHRSDGFLHSEKEEIGALPSRLIDEKISDETGAEAISESALAPAGLDNPFWN